MLYIGLAVLIGGGLILFGVGTGGGGGGLLNALGGGSNQQSSVVNSQVKSALRQTQQNPNSAAAWANLVEARYEAASSTGFDNATNTYTSSGKQQLTLATQAWQRYAKLVSKPGTSTATFAARSYEQVGQYSAAAAAWQDVTQDSPAGNTFACLAMNAYAAKQTRVAALAEAQAVSRTVKSQRASLKSEIEAATTQPTVAAGC